MGIYFWCQRKNILESKCRICTQVFKWEGDSDDIFLYSSKYMDFWDTHAEKLFCSDTYLSENCKLTNVRCTYFEEFYTSHQLVNMFGTIACRIFIYLGKRNFFVGRMNNEGIYRYYGKFTRKLFSFVCSNIRPGYANKAIYELRPAIDYDSTYMKIVNLKYTEYLESKKCT